MLYGAEVAMSADEHRERMLKAHDNEEHQFRFIVSPEDAHELDLNAYVRELMTRVEKDVGQPLVWSAVNHHDTAHPHAHVIVRGVDRNGRAVRFDREYMRHGFRQRAQTLATEWLGPRNELDLQRQSEREVGQSRWTQLDRRIERKARERHGVVLQEHLDGYERRRMQTLEQLGMVSREGAGWRLVDGWRERLREMGERGDIVKQMYRAMPGLDASRFVVMDDSLPKVATEGERVYGRVAELGLRDAVPNGMYALIETARGAGYYIPLRHDQLGQLREGDFVTMRGWTDRRGAARLSFDRQHLTLEQQVTYVGPTWLDAARPSGASEFARQVAKQQQAREEFLRGRKLERSALRNLERRSVARQYATARRSRVCTLLDGFAGRVVAHHEAASGNRYWVIEGAEGQGVAAVRADARGEKLVGRDVRIGLAERAGKKRVAVEINNERER
jgi:type IV secretory pathway VirD2 relaxase